MSAGASVARPYAKAAFEYALETSSLTQWNEQLATLQELFEEPQIASLIADPRIQQQRLIEPLLVVLDREKAVAGMSVFTNIVAANSRLAFWGAINALFRELLDDHNQHRRYNVYSAVELNRQQRKAVQEVLRKRFATEVDTHFETDASVGGGVRVEIGDEVIDATLARRFSQLEKEILQ